MAPRVGEFIHIATSDKDQEPKQVLVVGHDTAGNPEIIPAAAAEDIESLKQYVGFSKARELASRGLFAMELGV
jgi:hypothetical protein